MRVPLFIGLALSFIGCTQDQTYCHDFKSGHDTARLLAFGDSQTAGHASETSEQCGFSWANLLSVKHDLTLESRAVGGTFFTSDAESGALLRETYRSTDRVAMLIGFNDMRHFGTDARHLEDFKTALREALKHVSPQVHSVTVAGCLEPLAFDQDSQSAVDAYRSATEDVINELSLSNVTLVRNPGDSFSGDASYFAEDGIHLNLKGQQVIADLIDVGVSR